MGPRIDMGGAGGGPEEDQISTARRRVREAAVPTSRPAPSGRGPVVLAVAALVVALLALGYAWFNSSIGSEPPPMPQPGPGVVPGATAERVAKLDKDVRDLILEVLAIKKQVASMEKQLYSVRSKAGAVTKLTELSAKVAALQDRIRAMEGGGKAADPPAPAAARPAPPAPAPAAAKPAAGDPEPQVKKRSYKVQRGDTLWVVAQRYRVKTSDLRRWNKLERDAVIKVGQTLIIYK